MRKSLLTSAVVLTAVFVTTSLFAFRADDDSMPGQAKTTAPALKAAPPKMPSAGQKAAVNSLDGVQVEWDAKTGAPASIRGQDLSTKNLGGKNLAKHI